MSGSLFWFQVQWWGFIPISGITDKKTCLKLFHKVKRMSSVFKKTYLWACISISQVALTLSTVFSEAVTIPTSNPLHWISNSLLMLLAELKTDWRQKHGECVSTAPKTMESQSQFGLSSATKICTRIINKKQSHLGAFWLVLNNHSCLD